MEYKNLKNGSLAEEAEAWVVKLRSDRLTRADKVLFSQWLNISPAHRFAFDEALQAWDTLSAVAYVGDDLLISEDIPSQTAQPKGLLGNYHAPSFLSRLFRPLPSAFAAAGLVLALGLTAFYALPDNPVEAQRYESATGKTQLIDLADGSKIELNTDTVIEVMFSDAQRQVSLIKGEAYFSVAKDRERPFVVDFGSGTATAVGTAFNIYNSPKRGASVSVTEGIVDVRESADIAIPDPDPVRLKANQQVRVSKRGLSPVRLINTDRTIAWRERTIIFKDTPLSEALTQLNRYMETPVYGEDIHNLKISGTFSLNSPVETLDAIVAAFNLKPRESAAADALYLRPE